MPQRGALRELGFDSLTPGGGPGRKSSALLPVTSHSLIQGRSCGGNGKLPPLGEHKHQTEARGVGAKGKGPSQRASPPPAQALTFPAQALNLRCDAI